MGTVRGIITAPPLWPDGVPDTKRQGEPLLVELCRDEDGETPAMRRPGDSEILLVEDLPPYSHLRVLEPPDDDESRLLLEEVVREGLPLAPGPMAEGSA